MRKYFRDKNGVLKDCHIYRMLQAQKRHLSFHTPGHKRSGFDITELDYSDNLASPKGCILRAQEDIARLLGADTSFILTDGSTSGILAMLYAFKSAGYTRLALPDFAHKSVKNGCALCGITPAVYTARELRAGLATIVAKADGLLVVSPDYYGNVPRLQEIRALCASQNKPLLIDGAHGGHLKNHQTLYAGSAADMWVDGVHKSLPALTQGAVVSAKSAFWSEKLRTAVDIFRTTSPSYPVMASVEYAVKYPENTALENAVRVRAKTNGRFLVNEDWTKFCVLGGKHAFAIQKDLEKQGVYAEFCDGEILEFYLSPATKIRDFDNLCKKLIKLFGKYPYIAIERAPAPALCAITGDTERVTLEEAAGRICAAECGLFPPCVPLLYAGERITKEKAELLQNANNVFGMVDGKITVLKKSAEE